MKKASSWAVFALMGTLVFLSIAIFAHPHSHILGDIFAVFGILSFLSLGFIGVWWLIEDYNEEQRKNEYFNRLNTK